MKNFAHNRAFCSVFGAFVAFGASAAFAGWEGEIRTVGKNIPASGQVSRLEIEGSRMRMETDLPGMGKSQFVIDWKTGKAASIIHANRMVLEMDMKALGPTAGIHAPYCNPTEGDETCFNRLGFFKKGAETVNGYPCDIYEQKSPEGVLTRVWRPKGVSGLNGVRTQIIAKDGVETLRSDYVNLKKKSFDPKIFEIPQGYIKQDMTQMMKSFMGAGQGSSKKK